MNTTDQKLQEKERELRDKQEELDSQRGMLSAAIDELVKKNKNLIEALERVKQSNSELAQLLYHSSHGLRSPLNSMLDIINLMNLEPLPESLQLYSRHLESKASHMMEIMNSLSTLSVITFKDVRKSPVSIQDLIREGITYTASLADTHHVEIRYTNHLDPEKRIISDPFLLSAIIKPIMMNGLMFRDAGVAGKLHVETTLENGALQIRIEDDGLGISSEIRDRVYEMFYRGSEKSGGSGLGLFLAQKSTIAWWCDKVDQQYNGNSFSCSDTRLNFKKLKGRNSYGNSTSAMLAEYVIFNS